MRRVLWLMAPLTLIGALVPGVAGTQNAARFYEENCAVCHTIGGGDQAGPDLKGSTNRKDRAWLVRFLLDPEGVIKSGDEYAVRMAGEWGGLVMPVADGLTRDMAEALVEYIEQQSHASTGTAPPAEAPIVFTAADRARGLEIFTGRARLANAGPSCVACHGLGGFGGTSGGMLGPDLAAVHTRLGGSRGTTAWLARPPTPMMRAIYREASLTEGESRSLAALLEDAAAAGVSPSPAGRRRLALTGLAGTAVFLAAIGFIWRGRFHGVRHRLTSHAARPARAVHTREPGRNTR
jgi:mono/diheme cytochrome c family protein